MKVLRIIILLVIMASVLPLEAFCDDHHLDEEQHHCILACQNCHQVVMPDAQAAPAAMEQLSDNSFSYAFHYQEPFLDKFHRPPITLS